MAKAKLGRTYTMVMSTGERARIRRPSLFSIASGAGLPSELATMVWKKLKGEEVALVKEDPDSTREFLQFIELCIEKTFYTPKCSRTAEASDLDVDEQGYLTGTLALVDIADNDKQVLFAFSQGMKADGKIIFGEEGEEVDADALKKFLGDAGRAATGHGSEEVRSATKPADGDTSGSPAGA